MRRHRGALALIAAMTGAGTLLSACGSSNQTSTTPSSSSSSSSASGTITWSASPIAQIGIRAALVKAFEARYPKIKINLVSAPTNTDSNRAQLLTQLSAGSSSPDVFMGDVIWPAQFAAHGLVLPLSKHLPSSYWKRFAPGLVAGASYKGQVYASPLYADQGFLYYRKDLLAKAHLPVPRTWEQLMSESQTLQKDHLVTYGFVWQGASYEGLTCDFMEYLADAGGSPVNKSYTTPTINSPAAIKALGFMRSLITSGVSPQAVSTFQEPQAMATFDSGKAAFLRNWDYAWSNSQTPANSSVVGKVGVAPLPTFAGQSYPGYSTIGGWNLYVHPHSKNLAADLTFVKWSSSTQAQTILGKTYSEIPTVESVRQALAKDPTTPPPLRVASGTRLIPRPSGTANYPKLSSAIYANVNAALSGSVSDSQALATASHQMKSALSGGL